MNDNQRKLVEDNHNLIYHYLHSHRLGMNETVDWYGVAALALCDAAMTFDESRGVKFSTYAYKVIDNNVINTMRKEHRNVIPVIRLEDRSRSSDNESLSLADCVADDHNDFELIEIEDAIEKAMKSMSERDRQIVTDIVFNEKTEGEVAAKFGLSRQTVGIVMRKFRRRYQKQAC